MRRQGVAENPVLIGAGAILVTLVMVMLSYNANQGLPFVPTYDIKAEVPGGANLVKGNDVRIGGARVGLVSAIKPMRRGDRYFALLSLKLDQKIGPIPANSRLLVRARSTIGLKYIQLTLGDSSRQIPDGGTLPIKQSSTATEFEDLIDTFSKRVRTGNKRSLLEFGNALAGRGQDLNVAFGELAPLFENLEPVLHTLSAKSTRFSDFVVTLSQAATDIAAAGSAGGEVWANADRTFEAFALASAGIQDSLEEAPSTLDALRVEFPKQRPYLRDLTGLVKALKPSARYLPQVAEDMAVITVRGTPAFKHLSRSTPKFTKTFNSLGEFAADPQVQMGVKGLVTFVRVINDPLAYITPAQTVCNYAGIFARNIASATSNRAGAVGWLRISLVAGWPNPIAGSNSEVGPANAPANFGANVPGDSFNQAGASDFLHANPYPFTASPGQPSICAAGNEISKGEKKPGNRFLSKVQTIGNPADLPAGARTEDTEAVDQDSVKK